MNHTEQENQLIVKLPNSFRYIPFAVMGICEVVVVVVFGTIGLWLYYSRTQAGILPLVFLAVGILAGMLLSELWDFVAKKVAHLYIREALQRAPWNYTEVRFGKHTFFAKDANGAFIRGLVSQIESVVDKRTKTWTRTYVVDLL